MPTLFERLMGEAFDDFLNDSFFEYPSKKMISMRSNLNTDFSKFPSDDDPNFSKSEETFENDTHIIKKETWTSVDGTSTYSRATSESKSKKLDKKLPTIEDLKFSLDKAIEEQNFEDAIELRDKIKKLEEGK